MNPIPFFGLLLLLLIAIQTQAQPSQIVNLQSEYLVNPIGIDAPSPRLHWQLSDTRQGARQTAYQMIVGTDSVQVSKGQGNMYDSKKMKSAEQLVNYYGTALQPFSKYFWTVII